MAIPVLSRYGPAALESVMVEASTSGPRPEDETHFGFETVRLGQKQALVDDVFHKVADRYDLMNDFMSMGLHRAWKDVLVAMVKPPRNRPFHHLDVAGGTGDVAFRVAEAGGPRTDVTILDINGEMLRVGEARAEKRRVPGRLTFVEANAEELPFPDKSFDAYTIAFGIRNVPRIERALAEAHRVLKRGGRFLCLEFSSVNLPGLDKIYEAYSFTAIPAMGKAVTGDGHPYRYLVESIRKFPHPEVFRDMIEDAGFQRASYTRLTGGVVAIHSGWKL
jgi:demethylmenaquinone methyltransferase/2-methoxy-6-polyprenyl-1,4-benzoquinol methylase